MTEILNNLWYNDVYIDNFSFISNYNIRTLITNEFKNSSLFFTNKILYKDYSNEELINIINTNREKEGVIIIGNYNLLILYIKTTLNIKDELINLCLDSKILKKK